MGGNLKFAVSVASVEENALVLRKAAASRAIKRLMSRQRHKAFQRWVWAVQEARSQMDAISSAVQRWKNLQIAHMWRQWRVYVSRRVSARRLVNNRMTSIESASLSAAFTSLRHHAVALREREWRLRTLWRVMN